MVGDDRGTGVTPSGTNGHEVGARHRVRIGAPDPTEEATLHDPTDPVALNRVSHFAWQGKRETRWNGGGRRRIGEEGHRDRPGANASTVTAQLAERSPITDAPDQADRR